MKEKAFHTNIPLNLCIALIVICLFYQTKIIFYLPSLLASFKVFHFHLLSMEVSVRFKNHSLINFPKKRILMFEEFLKSPLPFSIDGIGQLYYTQAQE